MSAVASSTSVARGDTLLVVLVGSTDIKIAVRDGRRADLIGGLAEIPRKRGRMMHQCLLAGLDVWPSPAVAGVDTGAWVWRFATEPEMRQSMKHSRGRLKVDVADGKHRDHPKGTPVLHGGEDGEDWYRATGDGKLVLVPAKLDALAERLAKVSCAGVIVFDTARESDPEEPIAAGPLVAAWLAEVLNPPAPAGAAVGGNPSTRLQLTPGRVKPDGVEPGRVQVVAYLRGEETVEDEEPRDEPEDPVDVLNPVIRRRIETAMKAARAWPGMKEVVVCDGGGPGGVKPLALALGRLYFGADQTTLAHEHEHRAQASPLPVWSKGDALDTLSSADLRRRCLERIRCGDFVGAGSLVAALIPPEPVPGDAGVPEWQGAQPPLWVLAVHAVACWFSRLPYAEAWSRVASLTAVGDALWALDRRDDYSLPIVFQLEAALRAGRITEALERTYSVATTLVMDVVSARFRKRGATALKWGLKDRDLVLNYANPGSIDELDSKIAGITPGKDAATGGSSLECGFLSAGWLNTKWKDLVAAADQCVLKELQGFTEKQRTKCSDKVAAAPSERFFDIRNSLVHGSVPTEVVGVIGAVALELGIWCKDDSGYCFLPGLMSGSTVRYHPYFHSTFEFLGYDPRALYNALVAALEAALLDPDA